MIFYIYSRLKTGLNTVIIVFFWLIAIGFEGNPN